MDSLPQTSHLPTGEKCGSRGGGRGLRGFSLVEILIVVAIIAGLVGLLFPFAKNALERSREARCSANLRGIGQAISLYGVDHNMTLPPGNQDGNIWSNLNSKAWLREYGGGGSDDVAKKLLRCPSDQTTSPVADYKYYYSYTWNSDLLLAYTGDIPAQGRAPIKIFAVQRKILFADGISHAEDPGGVPKYPNSTTYQIVADRISDRHHKGVNGLWGDGSVRWVAQKDTQDAALWQRN